MLLRQVNKAFWSSGCPWPAYSTPFDQVDDGLHGTCPRGASKEVRHLLIYVHEENPAAVLGLVA